MGLERSVGEQAVVPDGDAEARQQDERQEQAPLCAGEADVDGVPRKRGETHQQQRPKKAQVGHVDFSNHANG